MKPRFGDAADQRRLAAFKADKLAVARAGALALLTARGGLSGAGAFAHAEADRAAARAGDGLQDWKAISSGQARQGCSFWPLYFPRSLMMSSFVRRSLRASKVAPTMLKGFDEPRLLVRMFLTPAASRTARTPPPAMTPVPGCRGLHPDLAGAELRDDLMRNRAFRTIGNLTRAFRACELPFRMAACTSLALPMP